MDKQFRSIFCGICGGVAVGFISLADVELTLCTDCLAVGPYHCALVLLEQAETALMVGRDLLRRKDWPLVVA